MKKELLKSMQTGVWYKAMNGDENPEAAFAFIKECGFEAVDFDLGMHIHTKKIRVGDVGEFYNQTVEALLDYYRPIKAAADKHGIAFAQAHGPFPMYVPEFPEIHQYLLMVVEKMCAICQLLECPYLIVHPIIVRNRQEEWERNLEMYRKLIPAARKYGVVICLENMFTTENGRKTGRACTHAATVCRYIDTLNAEAGEECFGFCYDVGHATLTTQDIYEDIKELGHRLVALHIHENDTRKDLHQIPYLGRTTKYELNTDWEGFLQALKEIGYRGTINLESAGSLTCIPQPLIRPMLQFGAAVCDYFRQKILE